MNHDPNSQPPEDHTIVDQDQPKVSKAIQFGRYSILKELARGGMGIIYLAKSMDLGVLVVLKVLKQMETSPKLRERFLREARLASRLNHPNIVRILDCGVEKSRDYIVMDYIEGEDLSKRLWRAGPLPSVQTARLLVPVCKAAHYAHTNKIVHRDLKTANILLSQKGVPMVTDFGIAKDLESDLSLTRTGAVMGSPGYMSPEQVMGEKVTFATDIYALGVILFEMLTGRLPYLAKTSAMIYNLILQSPIPSVLKYQQEGAPELDAICQRAMAKKPEKRFPTAQAMVSALEKFLRKSPGGSTSAIQTRMPPPSQITNYAKTKAPSPVGRSTSLRSKHFTPREKTSKKTLFILGISLFIGANIIVFLLFGILNKKGKGSGKKKPPKIHRAEKSPEKKRALALYQQGKKLYGQGKLALALSTLDRALIHKNDLKSAILLRARCLLHQGEREKATRAIPKKGVDGEVDFLLFQAHLAILENRLTKAQAILSSLAPSGDVSAHFALLQLYKKQYARALIYLNQALEKNPQNQEWISIKAGIYFGQKNYKSCLEACTQGIFLAPKKYNFYILRGKAYVQMGDYRAAKIDFKKGLSFFLENPIRKNSRLPSLYRYLGEVHFYLREYPKSHNFFQRDLAVATKSPQEWATACYWLGQCYIQLKQMSNALEMFKKAVEKFPRKSQLSFVPLVKIYYKNRRYHDAILWVDRGLKIFPNQMELVSWKSWALLVTKQYSKLVKTAERLQKNPKYREQGYELSGEAYYFLNKSKDSLRDYNLAFQYGMNCHRCLEKRGSLLLYSKDYTRALQNSNRLLQRHPHCFAGNYTVGMVYYYQHQTSKAIESFTKAIRTKPKSIQARYYRGVSYYKIKNYFQAKKDLAYVVRYSRNRSYIQSARGFLQKMR